MKFSEYLKQPATIWKIVAAVFVLWWSRVSLNYRIDDNTKSIAVIESMHLDVTIVKMQTDIAWIRKSMEK